MHVLFISRRRIIHVQSKAVRPWSYYLLTTDPGTFSVYCTKKEKQQRPVDCLHIKNENTHAKSFNQSSHALNTIQTLAR